MKLKKSNFKARVEIDKTITEYTHKNYIITAVKSYSENTFKIYTHWSVKNTMTLKNYGCRNFEEALEMINLGDL